MKYLYAFLLVVGLVSCSTPDNKSIYSKMALDVASSIPRGSKVAIRISSSDENGLPDVFLQKLVGEFAGALIISSESKFNILNRGSTEEVWQEAVEFNNQDAEKITSSAEADVSIKLSPKINTGGIDLTITAYSLKEGSTGNMIASVSELIPMNVKAELGVDVQTLDKKTYQLIKLLELKDSKNTNELAKLFFNFAEGFPVPKIVNTYRTGCEKAVSLTKKLNDYYNSPEHKQLCSDSQYNQPLSCIELYAEVFATDHAGFSIECEVHDNGKNLVEDNPLMNTRVQIEVENWGNFSFSPDSVTLINCCGSLNLPSTIMPFATEIHSSKKKGNTTYISSKTYSIEIPNKGKYFARIEDKCVNQGCNSYLRLYYHGGHQTDQHDKKTKSRIGNVYVGEEGGIWGVAQNYKEAMKWYKLAADQGDASSMIHIGRMYADGKGVTKDFAEAIRWHKLAASQEGDENSGWAQSLLGRTYYNGEGVTQDFTEAFKWYKLAADQKQPKDMLIIGKMYLNGEGVKQDFMKALKLFQGQAYDGNEAQALIEKMYKNGQGLTKANEKEYLCFIKMKHPSSCFESPNSYLYEDEAYNARSVGDYAKAFKIVKPYADQGDYSAQSSVAESYYNGEGVTQDFAEALKWYKLAAHNKSGYHQMGYIYAYGDAGVKKNLILGYMWYKLAEDNGDITAKRDLKDIANDMTHEQIATAQKLTRECKAKNYKNCGV
jgi:TPR repeat protein